MVANSNVMKKLEIYNNPDFIKKYNDDPFSGGHVDLEDDNTRIMTGVFRENACKVLTTYIETRKTREQVKNEILVGLKKLLNNEKK